MSLFEIILLAISLSMDSLAVSITSGSIVKKHSFRIVAKTGITFAIIQSGFTAIGYLMGVGFRNFIESIDHWIAFALLFYLGVKMIKESLNKSESKSTMNPLQFKTLCGMGIATSIDALAVGISLAILRVLLLPIVATIGIITLIFSAIGIYIGSIFGNKLHLKFDLIGGIILIILGIKILIEHLC